MTRIVSNLYAQENLRRLKMRHEAGETLFVEGTHRAHLQSIFEISRVRFWYHPHMATHIFMEIQELKLEGEIQHDYIDHGDYLWREDATESKKVRPKGFGNCVILPRDLSILLNHPMKKHGNLPYPICLKHLCRENHRYKICHHSIDESTDRL